VNSSNTMDILLFGDQAVDVYPFLHKLLTQRERTTLLTSFLNHVTASLRTDISNLPRLQRQEIPPLNNLLEFLGGYRKSKCRSAPVENALLCVSQLAHWIGYDLSLLTGLSQLITNKHG
jgi:hypothetical protein